MSRSADHAAVEAAAQPLKSILRPSRALLHAAISGLLGFSAGCDEQDEPTEEDDPETHEHDAEGLSKDKCEPVAGKASDHGNTGGKAGAGGAGGSTVGASGAVVGSDEEPDKEISTEDVQHTYAELTAMCEQRKGYVAIHGSCSGTNTCQGFFYGDWDEDAQLIEHTCSGVNGCAGLSCLVPAREGAVKDMTGEEIMKLDDDWYTEHAGQYGPKACRTCHIESKHNDETGDYDYDYTKLKIPAWAKAGRNAGNWLERPALYQENLVAFGARGMMEDGMVYSNMASYAKLFSKQEIKNVVEYMRKFDPKSITFKEIKLQPGKKE